MKSKFLHTLISGIVMHDTSRIFVVIDVLSLYVSWHIKWQVLHKFRVLAHCSSLDEDKMAAVFLTELHFSGLLWILNKRQFNFNSALLGPVYMEKSGRRVDRYPGRATFSYISL